MLKANFFIATPEFSTANHYPVVTWKQEAEHINYLGTERGTRKRGGLTGIAAFERAHFEVVREGRVEMMAVESSARRNMKKRHCLTTLNGLSKNIRNYITIKP